MRLKGYKIENTPSEKFPDMVTITKGKTINKKFITQSKAVAWIEAVAAENLIGRGKKKVKNELSSIGILTETAW
jgi:hypothetical protein